MSIIGLVLGIIALIGGIVGTTLLFSTVVGIICIVLGVVGIVLSVLGRKSGQNVGAGTAGMVISIIAVIFSIIFTAACACTHKATDVIAEQVQSAVNEMEPGAAEELESALNDAVEQLTGAAAEAAAD